MREHDQQAEYWVTPETLTNIGERIVELVPETEGFGDVCREISPMIARSREVVGAENIPTDGPLVVVKNHPCHFDLFLLEELFTERPDVKTLMRRSPYTEGIPPEVAILLGKEGPKADPDDVAVLQHHLRDGGSLLATPWGSLDHQAPDYTSIDRAATNALRYAQFSGATILPVFFETGDTPVSGLPLDQVEVQYGKPIASHDVLEIERVVREMYTRSAPHADELAEDIGEDLAGV